MAPGRPRRPARCCGCTPGRKGRRHTPSIVTLDAGDDRFPDAGLAADLGHGEIRPAPRFREGFADAHTVPPLRYRAPRCPDRGAPTIMVPPLTPCPLPNRTTVTWAPSALVVAGPDVERHHIGVGARRRTPAARLLPVGLLAQQRLTEPVELGDHLLRCRGYRLTGPFILLLQLPGHFEPNMGGDLVPRQGVQLTLGLTYRSPQILRGGVGFADHLAAFASRRLQSVEIAHGIPLARRLDRGRSQSRPVIALSATRRRRRT